MTVTLTQLRAQTREMSDLDEEDLPDSVVDQYAKEGVQRIYALERRWPFLETDYTLATVVGQRGYLLTVIGDVREVISVVDTSTSSNRLSLIAYDNAERVWLGTQDTAGRPLFYSVWGKKIHFWPKPDAIRTITIRAYRNPTYTWLNAPFNTAIDIDEWFHSILPYFVLSRVYMRQEDPELSSMNMQQFEQGVAIARDDLMKPSSAQPLIYCGGSRQPTEKRWLESMYPTLGP